MCTRAHKQANAHLPHIKHVRRIPPDTACAKVSRLTLSPLWIPNSSGYGKNKKVKMSLQSIASVFLHYNPDTFHCITQKESKNQMGSRFRNAEINDYARPSMFMDSNLLTSKIPQFYTVDELHLFDWFAVIFAAVRG